MTIWLALFLGCTPKHVDPPSLVYEWDIDRSTTPQASLRAMHVADTSLPAKWVRGKGKGRQSMPVMAYLYQHHTFGLVLIDTGYGRDTKTDPAIFPGKSTAKRSRIENVNPVADQLEAAGFSPDDVEHIIVTHLHVDHAGGINDFPNATLWVSEAEWDFSQKKRALKAVDPLPYEDHADVELIRFHAPSNALPYGAFEDHIDLFGDGGLVLLPTPGHTPGHMSVLVNLFGDSYMITGDTAWVDDHWHEPMPKGFIPRTILEDDWTLTMKSAYRIRDWTQRYPELHIISGHEAGNLKTLPEFPETMR